MGNAAPGPALPPGLSSSCPAAGGSPHPNAALTRPSGTAREPLVLPHMAPFPREPQPRVPACTLPRCQVKEQSPRAAGEKYFTDL